MSLRSAFLYKIGILFLVILSVYAPLYAKDNEKAAINAVQGEAFILKLEEGEDVVAIKGSILGRTIPFFKYKEGSLFGALIGIDIEDKPGRHELKVEISKRDGGSLHKTYRIKVVPGKFKTEDLTLPKESVELDNAALKRVAIEKKKTAEIFSHETGERLWKGNFIMPAEGRLVENFGSRRRLNGQPRAPHTGIDIAAPAGTEIHASNDGIVVMADDLFFGGKSIFIDHGLGIYTFYSHLSEVNVSAGDKIKKGNLIGRVGSTGRATGPHLHWGMKINGARINPLSATKALQE